jgi:AraC-like DNA-binding protein
MRVLLDTADVRPAERFDFWTEGASRLFCPLEIRQAWSRPFAGRVVGGMLGPVGVFRVAGDANACVRTTRSIGVHDPEHLHLHVVREGQVQFRQDDRTGTLVPGDMTTCDTSKPYTVRALSSFELTIYALPKVLLAPHADRIAARTALRIPGAVGFAASLWPFLDGIASHLEDSDADLPGPEFAGAIASLVQALHAAPPMGPAAARRPIALALLRRIQEYIDAHLPEPDLRPGRIAAAHFITTRYLHRLFELEGVTVSSWIRSRRLAGCRRDLLDPALSGSTIAEIARRWGLHDPAQVSRLFRKEYGSSPRELRESLAGDGAR